MGVGQATVSIMGKELKVLKRWGYEWKDEEKHQEAQTKPDPESQTEEPKKIKVEDKREEEDADQHAEREIGEEGQHQEIPPLWGLDLEALKKASSDNNNTPTLARAQSASTTNMPIHTPQAARAYLLKSFDDPPSSDQISSSSKKPSASNKSAAKERNLALLLRAIDLLYQSWIDTIGPEELDRRVWGWYVKVRPAVEHGVAGWGGKNEVRLGEILALRRES